MRLSVSDYDTRLACKSLIWGVAAARSIYIPDLNYVRSVYLTASTTLVISFPPATVPVAWGIFVVEAINFAYSTEWKKGVAMISIPFCSKCIDFIANTYVVNLQLIILVFERFLSN